ncbi:uncharacterized protein LOC135834252 [Planococcus citri]|uniref:uncharacterized protein LOC135834252 n=1 Tax=Planococcus citri TaxID=170843 RepID=UPI0031F948E3
MNEIIESNVYDLIYPSPVTLKEISSIVVVVELWREEICAHIESKRLQELKLNLEENGIQLRNVIPNLPSAIYDFLEKYVDVFGVSILQWVHFHHSDVLHRCDGDLEKILIRFHDFAWDWNGAIHYRRTAERLMLCDRLTEYEKFQVACFYCFEDDIKRIWPSVSAMVDLSSIDFDRYSQMFYWICCLRSELDKIPNLRNVSVDEVMLYKYRSGSIINHSLVTYFWDRIPSNKQPQIVIEMFENWSDLFCRFILPKLNKHQLEIFLTAKGADLVKSLLYFRCRASEPRTSYFSFGTWTYIRNKISTNNFIGYVKKSLEFEIFDSTGGEFYKNELFMFREIWKSASQHFKRSAVKNALTWNKPRYLKRTSAKFLIVLLQDATVEERNAFWNKNWYDMLYWCVASDSLIVMKLCLQTENEIALFNKNLMANHEDITTYCVLLMAIGCFERLNDFLSVCYPDVRERNEFKQRILRLHLLREDRVLKVDLFRNNKSLNEFINDAFQDAADLGVEFRNQFRSSPATERCLFECTGRGDFVIVMEFVDTFFPDEQVRMPMKIRLFEHFKEHLVAGSVSLRGSDDFKLDDFITWCFNNDENKIDSFKKQFYPKKEGSSPPRKRRRMV